MYDTKPHIAYIRNTYLRETSKTHKIQHLKATHHLRKYTIVKQLHMVMSQSDNSAKISQITQISYFTHQNPKNIKSHISDKIEQLTPENIYGSTTSTAYYNTTPKPTPQTTHFWKLWCQNTSPTSSLHTQISHTLKTIKTTHFWTFRSEPISTF